MCVIALAVLEGRVDWVEAGLSNVSSGIIALQRLATAEERAARAGALMHDAAVLREIYKARPRLAYFVVAPISFV